MSCCATSLRHMKLMTFAIRVIFDRRQGLLLLRDGESVERGLKTRRLKTSWQTSWTFRLLMSREGGRDARKGWKKYVLHFRWRGGNWRSYARETGSQIIYYSIVSRELPRIATRCDATGRSETRHPSCVIFHSAIDDNAIRGPVRRCRRNFSSVRKFHRAAFHARTLEFRNNEKRDTKFKTLLNVIIMKRCQIFLFGKN